MNDLPDENAARDEDEIEYFTPDDAHVDYKPMSSNVSPRLSTRQS